MAVAPAAAESLRSPSWAASRLSSSLLPAGRRRPRRRPQTAGSGRRPQTKRPIGTSICSPVGRCSAEGFWGSNASSLFSFSYTQLYGRIYHFCGESPTVARPARLQVRPIGWVGGRRAVPPYHSASRAISRTSMQSSSQNLNLHRGDRERQIERRASRRDGASAAPFLEWARPPA